CFPHVVNISVQTFLKVLAEPIAPYDASIDYTADDAPQDVVACARNIVTAVRSSGQRRAHLQEIIEQGNKNGDWKAPPKDNGENDPPDVLRVVRLLRDVETRWSSTYIMIDRLLELYIAVDKMLRDSKYANTELAQLCLSKPQLDALRDIREFLLAPHLTQHCVAAQKTPTLSVVLPLYAKLIDTLKKFKLLLPKISHGIQAAIDKLEEYMEKSRHTQAYAAAMGESCRTSSFFPC
ncbi:hypothetical protein BD626DRAFT_420481, partial [Schizophyllum amplum]